MYLGSPDIHFIYFKMDCIFFRFCIFHMFLQHMKQKLRALLLEVSPGIAPPPDEQNAEARRAAAREARAAEEEAKVRRNRTETPAMILHLSGFHYPKPICRGVQWAQSVRLDENTF